MSNTCAASASADNLSTVGFGHADPEEVCGQGDHQRGPLSPSPISSCKDKAVDDRPEPGAEERRKRKEGVVSHGRFGGPYISVGTFDED